MNATHIISDSTRIIPIKPENQVKAITKLHNGDLHVVQNSGESFVVSKDDETFQAFVVWTVLNGGF